MCNNQVHGQPTSQDLDQLETKLMQIAASFYSELGRGAHGHAGLLLNLSDFNMFAPGTSFVVPTNPESIQK